MPTCSSCGGRSVRIRRRFWERFFYKAIFRCEECGKTQTKPAALPLLSRQSVCPKCGNKNLKVRRKRDHVDSISSTFSSRLQGLLGAELHHCEFCRFQFYDFRKVAKKEPEPKWRANLDPGTSERT